MGALRRPIFLPQHSVDCGHKLRHLLSKVGIMLISKPQPYLIRCSGKPSHVEARCSLAACYYCYTCALNLLICRKLISREFTCILCIVLFLHQQHCWLLVPLLLKPARVAVTAALQNAAAISARWRWPNRKATCWRAWANIIWALPALCCA
jgi:hypothetical protein